MKNKNLYGNGAEKIQGNRKKGEQIEDL